MALDKYNGVLLQSAVQSLPQNRTVMRCSNPEQRAFGDRLRRQGKYMQTVKAPPFYFRALIAVAPPFDPETELGSDPREKAMMELLAPGPAISLNDFITEIGTKNKWEVVYRDNNPADFTVKYVIAVVIDALDT